MHNIPMQLHIFRDTWDTHTHSDFRPDEAPQFFAGIAANKENVSSSCD